MINKEYLLKLELLSSSRKAFIAAVKNKIILIGTQNNHNIVEFYDNGYGVSGIDTSQYFRTYCSKCYLDIEMKDIKYHSSGELDLEITGLERIHKKCVK